MLMMTFKIMMSPGPVLVYSNNVLMEGLQIFSVYLKYIGFSKLNLKNMDEGKNFYRYAEYHGLVDKSDRDKIIKHVFGVKENNYGSICKIILVSPAGSEGLNLFSIRQVHLMECYWHETRMTQIVGRAVRLCSHKYLPVKERHVDVYRYKSVRKNYPKAKLTTDQYIENMAREKQGLIQSFLDAVKEAAIDCSLYKAHNVDVSKCFQFEEKSLFNDQIGPAYKEDIVDDEKMGNGINNINSSIVRIKITKIMAVKQLTNNTDAELKDAETKLKDPQNSTKYSSPDKYWYYPESGVVYDFDSHFPIGKISYDEMNIPRKFDGTTYIIDKLIPIPIIKYK